MVPGHSGWSNLQANLRPDVDLRQWKSNASQSINQLIKQSIKQSIKQAVSQSINQSVNQPIKAKEEITNWGSINIKALRAQPTSRLDQGVFFTFLTVLEAFYDQMWDKLAEMLPGFTKRSNWQDSGGLGILRTNQSLWSYLTWNNSPIGNKAIRCH